MKTFIQFFQEEDMIPYEQPKIKGLTTFSAHYSPGKRSGHINMIDVHPDYKGKGIGSSAVRDFEHWVGTQGGKHVTGDALPSGVSFLRKQGYKVNKTPHLLGGLTRTYRASKKIEN